MVTGRKRRRGRRMRRRRRRRRRRKRMRRRRRRRIPSLLCGGYRRYNNVCAEHPFFFLHCKIRSLSQIIF